MTARRTRYVDRHASRPPIPVHPGNLPHRWHFPSPTAGEDRIVGTCDCGATQSALAYETTAFDEMMKHQAKVRANARARKAKP